MADHKEESREVVRTGYDEQLGVHYVGYADGSKAVALTYPEYSETYKAHATKWDVDVSDALTGLKAVTREAREATKAVKALETESGRITVDGDAKVTVRGLYLGTDKNAAKRLPTDVLVEELASRDGVFDHDVRRHFESAEITVTNNGRASGVEPYSEKRKVDGPARILVVNPDE